MDYIYSHEYLKQVHKIGKLEALASFKSVYKQKRDDPEVVSKFARVDFSHRAAERKRLRLRDGPAALRRDAKAAQLELAALVPVLETQARADGSAK